MLPDGECREECDQFPGAQLSRDITKAPPMPTEYATMESATENVINFLCTHKNMKVNNINHGQRNQMDGMNATSVTYC
jgi:hypothetical protein